MGMNQKIAFVAEKTPAWSALVEWLAARRCPIDLRMIDGELSYPDETPPENWREVRFGTPAGMITMRRDSEGITLVIWGNADDKLQTVTNEVAKAIAELTGGSIV